MHAVVSGKHASNVRAFNIILKNYAFDSSSFFKHEQNHSKNFLFDNVQFVHIVKNVRNNLLNSRNFVFQAFLFAIEIVVSVSSPNGYIFWNDFKKILDCDATLSANLQKAHKLTLKALYPYNNKQNVGLALDIFHDTTFSDC